MGQTKTAPEVETVRRAATLMRERAAAAEPGPWRIVEEFGRDIADEAWTTLTVQTDTPVGNSLEIVEAADSDFSHGSNHPRANTEHIASWHPAVALAVADWLDQVAADHRDVESVDLEAGECVEATVDPGFKRRTSARHLLPALDVARAYLNED